MTRDVVIIGSGPAGYVCAIRAAQLGLSVSVIERRATHGGTCLNIGCIPSKALLHASHMFETTQHDLAGLGIKTGKVTLDLPGMHAHKDATVKANVDGIAFLLKKNRIEIHHGTAQITAPGEVTLRTEDDSQTTVSARSIVIATGSKNAELPGITIDEKKIVSSTGALALTRVPREMVVIGAGVIGLEMGSVWRRLGAKVTFVEYLDKILGPMDHDISRNFQRLLTRQGLEFRLSSKVTGVAKKGTRLALEYLPAQSGAGAAKPESLAADIVLVAVGRTPNIDGLGLDALGIKLTEGGAIATDAQYRTSVEGIYAIGDVIGGAMLAHKGEDEGAALAELLAGEAGHVNYDVIPNVIYTEPELASIGPGEEELKARAISYRVGKFPFSANGRARAMNAADGYVKILSEEKTDRVLGAHIIGHGAGELIHECAVLMEFGGSAEDLARTCHAHPTLSEAVREAGMAAGTGAIHI